MKPPRLRMLSVPSALMVLTRKPISSRCGWCPGRLGGWAVRRLESPKPPSFFQPPNRPTAEPPSLPTPQPFHHVGHQRIHILQRHRLYRGLTELGWHRNHSGVSERALRIHDGLESRSVGVETLHCECDHHGSAHAWA